MGSKGPNKLESFILSTDGFKEDIPIEYVDPGPLCATPNLWPAPSVSHSKQFSWSGMTGINRRLRQEYGLQMTQGHFWDVHSFTSCREDSIKTDMMWVPQCLFQWANLLEEKWYSLSSMSSYSEYFCRLDPQLTHILQVFS